jgi:hypothetical protein
MSIFLLVARGGFADFTGTHTILHKRAYHTKEKAEGNVASFLAECVNPKDRYDLSYLDVKCTEVSVVEIELSDD